MKMNAEQLQAKWDEVIELINNTFEGKRKDNILKMYEYFKDRMMFAPASGIVYYHNAFPGGYVCHILNVTRFALKLYKTYKKLGLHTSEYDKEAIIFCALHHDLGKVGNLEYDYYTPNESEWHRINQGKMYDYDKQFMGIGESNLKSEILPKRLFVSITTYDRLGGNNTRELL